MTLHLTVPLQLKALDDREFEGYGSVFGNVDLGGDVVVPGAFSKSLAQHKAAGTLPQMFWMHDASMVPGKWVEMHEDAKGLYVKGIFANTQLGQETRELVKMNAVRGLSIGYQTEDANYDKDGNRLLKTINLWEVSPVSLAMNPLAQVTHAKCQLSAAGEYVPSERQLEESFRKMGCSRSVARTLVSRVFSKAMMPEESPEDWMCSGARDLPVVRDQTWDGSAAAQSILDHAGIGTDHGDTGFAKRGFLFVDNDEANERTAYKEPFARVINGTLHASSAGIAAAAQRLSSVDGPSQSQKDEAQAIIQHYEDRLKNSGKSQPASGTLVGPQWDAESDMPEDEEEAVHRFTLEAIRGFR